MPPFSSLFVSLGIFSITSCLGSRDAPLCLDLGGTRMCSKSIIPNGEQLSDFMKKLLDVPVNRTGHRHQMTPQAFTDRRMPLEGVLAPNNRLDEKSQKVFNHLIGAESNVIDGDFLYSATVKGIYETNMRTNGSRKIFNGNSKCSPEKPCSRPLGLRVKNGKLYCADALAGLLEVDIAKGLHKILIPVGTPIDGIPVSFLDDLDVDWEKGYIYVSEGSTKWPLAYFSMAVFESDSSGRIIRYNIVNGDVKVFASGIRFPNGVQLTHDKKSLLVNEVSSNRVLEFNISASLPVASKPFTETLPCYTDNIRSSRAGGYWVACFTYVNKETVSDEIRKDPALIKKVGDWMLTAGDILVALSELSENPGLELLGEEIRDGNTVRVMTFPRSTAMIEIDKDGRVLQVLQSEKSEGYTEAIETEDALYIGNFMDHALLKIAKKDIRNDKN